MSTGHGEFAIGFGDAPDLAVQIATGLLADKAVREVTNAMDEIRQMAYSPIDDAIQEAADVLCECNGCITGRIDNLIGEINDTIGLVNRSIITHLDFSIEDIGSRIYGIFQELPVDEAELLHEKANRIDPSTLVDLTAFESYLSSTAGDPPCPAKPDCPDGSAQQCPETADWVCINGEWKCQSTLDGSFVDPICIVPPPPPPSGKYECIDNKCVITPTGTMTLEECQKVCKAPPPPPPEPGERGTCTNSNGETVACTDASVTEWTCTDLDGNVTTWQCINEPGHCPGLESCTEILLVPPPPPPPDPPDPPPPDPTTPPYDICAHAVMAPSDNVDLCKDSYLYWTKANDPATTIKVKGQVCCLCDGTAEFVCGGRSIWKGPIDLIGKPQGRDGGDWDIYQEIDENDNVLWYYVNEEHGTQMIFDEQVFFYYLQFGHVKDQCKVETAEIPEIPCIDVTKLADDFCSPDYAKSAETGWVTVNQWGDITLEKLNSIIEANYHDMISANDSWWNKVTSWLTSLIQGIMAFIIFIPLKVSMTFGKILPTPKQCKNSAYGPLWYFRALIDGIPFVGNWIPKSIRQYLQILDNYNCQMVIPSASEIQRLYNHNHLNKDEWKFGLKMNGMCIDWQQRIADEMEQDFSVGDCVQLLNSNKFDKQQFKDAMHEIGWVGDEMLDNVKYLGKVVPSVNELFEGMTRNINDQKIIDSLGLNDLLDERNVDDTKEWMDRHGMTDEVLRYRWRLHWKLIDQRVVLRLYLSDQIDRDEMVKIYQYNGHPPKIAEKLADAVVSQYWNIKAQRKGKRTLKEVSNDYMAGHIDEEQFYFTLIDMGATAQLASEIINASDERWNYAEFQRMLKPVRKAFMDGEIDKSDYVEQLIQIGMNNETATTIADDDEYIRSFKSKPIVLSKLCKLVSQGHMSMDDYMTRVKRFGYNPLDASILAASCVTEIQAELQKKIEAAQRQAVKEAQDEQRALEKAIKKREAQARKDRSVFMRHRETKNPPLKTSPVQQPVPDGFGGFGTN